MFRLADNRAIIRQQDAKGKLYMRNSWLRTYNFRFVLNCLMMALLWANCNM